MAGGSLNYLVGVRFQSSGNLFGAMGKLLAGFGALTLAEKTFQGGLAKLAAAGVGVFTGLAVEAAKYQQTLISLQNSIVGLKNAHEAMSVAMKSGTWTSAFSPEQVAQGERLIAQFASRFPKNHAAAYAERQAELMTWMQHVYGFSAGQSAGYEARMMESANTYVRLMTGLHGAASIGPTFNLMAGMLEHGGHARNFRDYLNFVTGAMSGKEAGVIMSYLNPNQVMGIGAFLGQVKGASAGLTSIITALAGRMPGQSVAALLLQGMGVRPADIKTILGGQYKFSPVTLRGFESDPLGTIKRFFGAYLGPHATWAEATKKLSVFGPSALPLWEALRAYTPQEMARYRAGNTRAQMDAMAKSSVWWQFDTLLHSFSRMVQSIGNSSGAAGLLTSFANAMKAVANAFQKNPILPSALGQLAMAFSAFAMVGGIAKIVTSLGALFGLFGGGGAAAGGASAILALPEIIGVTAALAAFFEIWEHTPEAHIRHLIKEYTLPRVPVKIPGTDKPPHIKIAPNTVPILHIPSAGNATPAPLPPAPNHTHLHVENMHVHVTHKDDVPTMTRKMQHALKNATKAAGIHTAAPLIGDQSYGW